MWYKTLLILLCPILSYGQHLESNWSQAVDTFQTKTIHPKLHQWLVLKTTNERTGLEILVPKKAFYKLAQKHYQFLKKTGASVFFSKCGQVPPHIWFQQTVQKIKQHKSGLMDSSFVASLNALDDFKLIVESLMSKGELVIKYQNEYISKYIVSQLYPKRVQATMDKKYVPWHLHGNGGNTYFRLLGEDDPFYAIVHGK